MSDKPPIDVTSPPRSPTVRQVDVARAAAVSTATVSRVLNGSDLVRPDVRARVEAAIASLGYIPHEGARALARRQSRTLGAIIPTLNNAIFAAGVNAFEAQARAEGYGLVISVSNYDPVQEAALIRQMVERGVDGLMLVGLDRAPEARHLLTESNLRHVCAWAHDPAAPGPDVGFDNAAAMGPVVDHLIGLGRRRIVMLSGLTADNDRARARVRGARAALAAHDVPLLALTEIRYSVAEARAALLPLLDHRPDAVICGNDVIAYGVLSAARTQGLDVPGDLAVTGFDDLPLSADFAPPLTSVAVPADAMGRFAATELIAAMAEDRAPKGQRLETRLIARTSTTGR